MEFWGVEVPAGSPLTCDPGVLTYVHISQAALGESQNVKGNERVVLKVTVGNKEVVVGTLSQGRCDQTALDLIFQCEFKLSHNSTSSSVYFSGYKTDAVPTEQNFTSEEESEEEDVPKAASVPAKENGKAAAKGLILEKEGTKESKPDEVMAKPTVKAAVVTKLETSKDGGKTETARLKSIAKGQEAEDEEEDDDEDEIDDDMSDDYDEESDEEESEEEDEDESEDEPKSVGNKRPLDNMKSSSSEKKAKLRSIVPVGKPEVRKTEMKTPATPAPVSKQQASAQTVKKDVSAKRTPAREGAKSELPTSGKKAGQYLCQPCNRNFTSEGALSQHNVAKHLV